MDTALHKTSKVLPGHRIEVVAPELTVGQTVEVFVLTRQAERKESFLDLLERTPAPGLFTTPEEADAFIASEREAWDD